MKKTVLLLSVFILSFTPILAQNLLDTSTWTVGSGSVSGFSQNGSTSENTPAAARILSCGK